MLLTQLSFFDIFEFQFDIYRWSSMSRRCEICGKGSLTGNKVSKSMNHTRKTWKPNIIEVKTEFDGTTRTLKVCTRCLRSGFITKKV